MTKLLLGVYNDLLSCTTQYKGRDIVVGEFLFRDMMESVGGSKFRANFKLFHELKAADKLGQRNVLVPSNKAVNAKSLARQIVKRDPSAFPMEPKDGNVYLCFGCLNRNGRLIRVCGYSRVIGMICIEAGIPFEIIDIDWRNKPAWFLASTPGRTPVIYLNGEFTYNTRNIITTLQEAFPAKIAHIMLPHKLPLQTFELYSIYESVVWGEITRPANAAATPEEPSHQRSEVIDEASSASDMLDHTTCQCIWTNGSPLGAAAKAKADSRDALFLCAGGKVRGESIVKACVVAQQLEAILISSGIPHWFCLVDIDNPPEWLPGDTSFPALIHLGSIRTGSLSTLVQALFDLDPERMQARFPRGLTAMAEIEQQLTELRRLAEEVILHRSPEMKATALRGLETEMLSVLEATLERNQPERLGRAPFLNGSSCGLEDLALAPSLSLYTYLLEAIVGYKVAEKFPRTMRYVSLTRQMAVFRRTIMPEPKTLFVRDFLRRLKPSAFDGALPAQCSWNAYRRAQEAETAHVLKMKSEAALAVDVVNAEGAIDSSGGEGPTLEPNRVYLASGCGMRGYQKVRVCPFSRVVEMTLLEADIPYELLMINLADKPTWFTEATNGFCPNLYWNGQWIANSQDVLDAIRVLFPRKMADVTAPNPLPVQVSEMPLFEKTYDICAEFLKARRSDKKRQEKLERLEDYIDEVERALQTNNPGFVLPKDEDKDRSNEREGGEARADVVGNGGEEELTLTGGRFCINDIALGTPLWTVVYVTMGKLLNYNLAETFPYVNAYLEQLAQRSSFKTATFEDPVPFILYWTAKMYGETPDSPDADDSFIILTHEIYQAEKDAVSKAFLNHRTSMRGKSSWTMEKIYQSVEAALEESNGPFLCGKEVGMVDILFASSLYTKVMVLRVLRNYSLVLHGFSRLQAYREKFSTMPRFDSIFPKEKYDYLFVNFILTKMTARPPDSKLSVEELQRLEKEEALRAELALEEEAMKQSKREKATKQDSHSEASLRLMQTALGMTKAGSVKFKKRGEPAKGGKHRRVKAKAVNVDEQDLLFCL